MTATKSFAKVAAIVAMLGLVVMSFASFAPAARAATFTMDLTIGSTGAEVTALQTWLIAGGYSIPAGATGYFGAQTQAALAAYQKANGISPAVGYFGPITRAKVNMGGSTTGGSTGGSTSGDLSGGEASLENFSASAGDDGDVNEGETAQVAEFEFDVEDGDIEIQRLDLIVDAGASNDENDPWDAFNTITILDAEGNELASEDVTDDNDWRDDTDPYSFRFTGLDYVVQEGETAKLIVEVEANNNVDMSTAAAWTLSVGTDGIRGTDGEGLTQEIGDASETVSFDIEAEGADEDLDIKSSTDDPDATTLEVENSSKSDWYTIFVFDLEADEVDAELNEITINLQSSDSDVRSVVNDMKLVIDGEEFDNFDWGTTNALAYGSTTFDIDGDFTVEDGQRVPVEVMVEFKALSGNYVAGATISASTTGSLIDAEGSDDITVGGSASGDRHTLAVDGLSAALVEEDTEASVDRDATPDLGTFTIKVELTAFGDDIYVPATTTTEDTSLTSVAAATGWNFDITNDSADATDIDSGADLATANGKDYYLVREGDTEWFTIQATASSSSSIFAQLKLGAIQYGTSTSDIYSQTLYVNENDYKTAAVSLSN